jgi:inner membrane protein
MEEFLTTWGEWTWWIVAVGLAALELIVPGVLLIWLAGAAVVVAFLGLVFDMSWQVEVALFALLSVVSAYSGYRWSNKPGEETDSPNLNKRGQTYVGRAFVVVEAIENGRGKIQIGDTLWQAEGPNADVGTTVTVTGSKGATLMVTPQ